MHEREPFPTEDPREKDVGDQYPEENPGGTVPRERDPERGDDDVDAPGTSHESEGDPGQATGNPDAAG
jgi:hypothetical protein